jgi:guanyl-specific ribonuclease Sa
LQPARKAAIAGVGVAYNSFTNLTLTGGNLVFTVHNPSAAQSANAGFVNGFQIQIITPNPLIATQPVGQSVVAGTPVSFSVGAAGTAPLSYQWQATNNVNGFTNLVNGGQISGANTNLLTIASVTPDWALVYRVIVTNSVGSVTSAPASLAVQTVPVITTQPVSQTTVAGSTVSFNVVGTGGLPLSYQWQATNGVNGFTNLVNGGQINGATNNVLTLSGVATNWPLAYQVILANSYGSVTSTVANLSVVSFVTQPIVPNPGTMGPLLAANVVGSYSSAPVNLSGNIGVTTAPVTGNGDMAIIVGEPSSALRFYVGKADFFGVLRGAIMPVGSLVLNAPALSGSSYALNQNVGPATITGNFVNGTSALSVTSWVASAENTAVIQLNNTGTSPLSLSSQLLDGFASSAGNPATYGATNNSTWLNVSPDTVYLELGNQLHNELGTAPFTGRIADLRLFNQVLPGATLANLDGVGVPTPLLRWSTTNMGAATLSGSASLNSGDPHGGSVVLTGGGSDELALGDLPLPERQFTVSAWVYPTTTGGNGNLVTAQYPYVPANGLSLPFPFVRGLTLKLVNGALSATLNQSGTYNSGNDEFGTDSPNHFTTTAGNALPANQWTEAAVTYDGNTLTIYTNGVALGTPVVFPTGTSGMLGWNKLALHLGDTNVIYNGCAPQGVLMQSVLGATATTNGQGALAFTIPAGGQVTLVLAAVTDRNKTNYFAAAQQQSQSATPASLTNLFQAHSVWWSNFWSKSYVQIPDQQIQNYWYASLYLLACCSTSNAPPPGIWGNFVTANNMAWQGDYTLDYNYESPFLGPMACNHMELTDNYDKPLLEQMGRGQAAAADNFGTGNTGVYFPVHLIASPGYSDDPYVFEQMKVNAIYAAVDCAQRWKYTQDTNYAAKVYPYLKGVAAFWTNYLVLSGGYYVDNNDATYEFGGADVNPAMTLAYINLVFPVVIQMSQALNVDASSRAQWSNVVANLTPLPIVPASSIAELNNLGAPYNNPGVNVVRDTTSGTPFDGANVKVYQDHTVRGSGCGQGSMQTIYPGWNIGLESDPYTLQAGYNTVWLMGAWFDANADNFSYASAACIGFDPNQILSNLDTFLSLNSYNNFMLHVGGGGIELCATVPGALAAMFVQSYQTNIHVFADWPTNQSAAFGNLNACGGFLVSGAITLGTADYVQIQSTAGQLLKLANPWPGTTVQCVSSVNGTNTLYGAVLYYQTQVGEVLTLTSVSTATLPAPANLTAVTNGNAVMLTWNAVPGAGGYNVKRANSIGGPYLNLVSGLPGTNYTDALPGNATTYYYAVTALAPGFESTNSTMVAVTTPPAPPILNWSFEAQSVTAASFAVETPTSWNVSGKSGGAVVAVIHPAAGDNRFSTYPPPGLDGVNYCQLYMNGSSGSATVYQDTGIKYQAGSTYKLTAAFGQENGTFPAGALVLYNSSLGVIAATNVNSTMLTSGAFTSISVTYTATGSEGGNGDIVVGFMTTGAASGTYFDVDNVRLTWVGQVSTNDSLASLTLNPVLSFSPTFAANGVSYAATEAYGSSPTVTVMNADLTATNQLIYNGTTNVLGSGVASAPLVLTLGATNSVQVQVTAQDGVTVQTYTVNVTELPSQTKPVLTSSLNNGMLTLTWPADHLGYRLLMQTNNLNLGVSVNPNDWATVPGSMATNATSLSIPITNFNEYEQAAVD